MPTITPSFLFDLETNMRTITAEEYQRLTTQLWWRSIAKEVPSMSAKDRRNWLLDTARIQRTGHGGNVEFEDIVALTQETENLNAAAGLEIKKEKFEDVDGNGIQYATHWSRQMGSYAAYWPQKMVAQALLANGLTYDGLSFFNAAHPVNPLNTAAGTFRNVFTGAAVPGEGYPGAVPIDASVTLDVAVNNIAKALAYIAALKMPNGIDPRFMRVDKIFVPPAMIARAQQLTNAKFIAQAAAGGAAGSGDIEAVIRNFGLGQPVEVYEIGAAFGGSDTTWYLGMQEILSNELGAFTYTNREAFSILYYGPQNDAQLARIRKYQWTTEGRNVVTPGHPYLLFKAQAT